MYITEGAPEARSLRFNRSAEVFVTCLALMVVITGILPDKITETVHSVAAILFPTIRL